MNKFTQSDDYRRNELIRIIEHSVEKLTLQELEAISALNQNLRSNALNDPETFPW